MLHYNIYDMNVGNPLLVTLLLFTSNLYDTISVCDLVYFSDWWAQLAYLKVKLIIKLTHEHSSVQRCRYLNIYSVLTPPKEKMMYW